MKIPILLTSTINCLGVPGISRTDSEQRLQDYIDALQFYLEKTDHPIIFVENSGYDLTLIRNRFKEYNDRLELIGYDGNELAKENGKGQGENDSIHTAIEHSLILQNHNYFVKVSGRYKTLGFLEHIGNLSKLCYCRTPQNNGNITTVCFIIDKFIYQDFLPRNLCINDSGTILETHFANMVNELSNMDLVEFIPSMTYIDTYTSQGIAYTHD